MPLPPAPPFLVLARGASRLADVERRAALARAAVAAIERRTGLPPEVRHTASAGEGRAAAREAADAGSPLLVVAGGDGSVRSAAAVVAGTGTVLGIVPAGTGNLLAAALRVPRSPVRAIEAIPGATERTIDLGRARVGGETGGEARPFVVAAGIGFDARVMAATTDRRKRSLGVAAYFAAAVGVATRVRPFAIRLVVDGEVHETDALAVLVANSGELIPGLLAPRLPLVPDDGVLDVLVGRGSGAVGGTRGALELMLGRGRHTAVGAYAARFAARRIEVIGPPGEPVEIDGDVVGAGHLVAEVEPGALRVLVPAPG